MRYNIMRAVGLVILSVIVRDKLNIDLEMFEWFLWCFALSLCSYDKEVSE